MQNELSVFTPNTAELDYGNYLDYYSKQEIDQLKQENQVFEFYK